MKNKSLSIFLIMLGLLLNIPAGNAQNTDGGATVILKKVAAQYKTYSTLQFRYTLKTTKDNKTLKTEQGTFALKGNKYHATYSGQSFFCNGITVWNYQKATNEVSIYEYDPTDDNNIMNPQRILTSWDKKFRAKYIRDEYVNGISLMLIDLTPKTSQSYYRIRLFINKANNRITRISMYDKDSTIYSYYIEQFKVNLPLPDSYFTFTPSKYPGIEINDMR